MIQRREKSPTYAAATAADVFFCVCRDGVVFEIWPFEIKHETNIKLSERWRGAREEKKMKQIITIDC